MRTPARISLLACLASFMLFAFIPTAFPQQGSGTGGIVVGRISHIEGQLLRFVPEDNDWVAAVKDAPFGLDDALFSEEKSRAEFIIPNKTWVRISEETQIQAISFQEDATEVDVASGVARFYNRGKDTVIKATTPFGYVVAPGDTAFDLYVGDKSVEVIALKGTVDFVLEKGGEKYEVQAGSASLLCDGQEVSDGDGNVSADWDDWNADRDDMWAKKLQVKGDSVKYLPPNLEEEASALDEHGRWEKVYYKGEEREMWRPNNVSEDWAPYTEGRWTEWNGDQTWVPEEPYGYVTHHYGSWDYVDDCRCWYWSRPVVRTHVETGYSCGTCWNPGRVGWIYNDNQVGWYPLTPAEPYYCARPWYPGAVVVGLGVAAVGVGLAVADAGFYLGHAVIVNQRDIYRVNNYNNVRITNINKTTIINNYNSTKVVNNKVFKDQSNWKNSKNFTNQTIRRKPDPSVKNRIQHNQAIAKNASGVNAKSIQHNVGNLKQGKIGKPGNVPKPTTSKNKLGPASGGPKSKMISQPKPKDLKGNEKKPGDRSTGRGPDRFGKDRGKIPSPKDRGVDKGDRTPGQRDKVGRDRIPSPRDRGVDKGDRTPGQRDKVGRDRIPSPRDRGVDKRDRTPGQRDKVGRDRVPSPRDRRIDKGDRTPGQRDKTGRDRITSPRDRQLERDKRTPKGPRDGRQGDFRSPRDRKTDRQGKYTGKPQGKLTSPRDRRTPGDRTPSGKRDDGRKSFKSPSDRKSMQGDRRKTQTPTDRRTPQKYQPKQRTGQSLQGPQGPKQQRRENRQQMREKRQPQQGMQQQKQKQQMQPQRKQQQQRQPQIRQQTPKQTQPKQGQGTQGQKKKGDGKQQQQMM